MTLTPGYTNDLVAEFTEAGYWTDERLSDVVAQRRSDSPDAAAIVADDATLSWSDYDRISTDLAGRLAASGLAAGDRVAVLLPDLATTHCIYLALERAGCVTVGIGPRSGPNEIAHLLRVTRSRALLSQQRLRDRDLGDIFEALSRELPALKRHYIVEPGPEPSIRLGGEKLASPAEGTLAGRAVLPSSIFLLNATSGTTGLPKCVEHSQNRWFHFARLAVKAGRLGSDDVMMSALPTPFGFGLWSAHFTPAVLGIPTVLIEQWDPEKAVGLLQRHRVTVFAGVTTQLMMLLDVIEKRRPDLSHLRVVFTGGEAVPFERARRFEELAGCSVLQFYGSNESGALSYTSLEDSTEQRLRTAGRIIPEMDVRLVRAGTTEAVELGSEGQPTCRGPLMSSGYFNDDEANRQLFDDGRLRMPDLAVLSADGYLRIVGRVADIIIRGGTNVSASEVEGALSRHPAVELVGVVGSPDPTFGERICAFIVTRDGATVTLEDLQVHMKALGMARYTWPERLHILDAMPLSPGEKIAKSELKRLAATI